MNLVNIILFLTFSVFYTHGIMFNLNPNTQKCLKDEMQAHQLVAGEYEVSGAPGQVVDYFVNIIMLTASLTFKFLIIIKPSRHVIPRAIF